MKLAWIVPAVAVAREILGVQPGLPSPGTPSYGSGQSTTLLQHTFGNSWGSPATATLDAFTGDLSTVQLELQLSSSGVQYDRLMHIYINNVEIWRPSTPEPGSQSISSNMTKDVSQYLALFKAGGTLTFELDNVQDSTYTGAFDITLIANYYSDGTDKAESQWYYSSPPDAVAALTNGLSTAPPDVGATIPKVDTSVYRAGIQIYATGNSDEEFYYTLSESGAGPTRLVEVYVGSTLAGIIDPFQPIYTGGMQPSLWTPIVGVNTYDVPSFYVDISAFLPILWTSSESVTIRVINGYSSTSVGSNWLVSAALMSWKDASTTGTGGQITTATNTSGTPSITTGGYNGGSVSYIGLSNTVTVAGTLEFSDGSSSSVSWQQSSTALNAQFIGSGSDPQMYLSYAEGKSSYSDGSLNLQRTHEYPLAVYMGPSNDIAIDHSYIVANSGSSGVSSVNNNVLASWGTSDTTQATCSWTDGSSWTRVAKATSNNLVSDNTSGGGSSGSDSWAGTIQSLVSSSSSASSLGSWLASMASTYGNNQEAVLSTRDIAAGYLGRTFHRENAS